MHKRKHVSVFLSFIHPFIVRTQASAVVRCDEKNENIFNQKNPQLKDPGIPLELNRCVSVIYYRAVV